MNPFFETLSKEELLKLLEVFAKNWLAHDGCWFLSIEENLGMDKAIEFDTKAWQKFAEIEAKRIMKTFNIKKEGGLDSLMKALKYRLYSAIVPTSFEWEQNKKRLKFTMEKCRVQEARRRKDLPPFPCKGVGNVEFSVFAKTVNEKIECECLFCPPDENSNYHCSWLFKMKEGD